MAWYNAAWLKRRKLTIDHTKVPSDLTNFPVYVNLRSVTGLLTNCQSTADDVLFTAADGTTKLDHELVRDQAAGLGAWTWFNHPRAVYYAGTFQKTYWGQITSSGDVVIHSYRHDTGVLEAFTLKSALNVDDHSNPAILVRSDGKLLVMYCAHTGSQVLCRISTNAEDISAWGTEIVALDEGAHTYSYANPVYLSAQSRIFCFTREDDTANKLWIYFYSDDGGATWSTRNEIWSTGAEQPYLIVTSNGVDRIDFLTSHKHPGRAGGNSKTGHFYYLYATGTGKFYTSAGVEITSPPFDHTEVTMIYDGASGSNKNNWIWAIDYQTGGNPHVLMAFFESVTDHRLMYSKWNGSAWTTPVEIAAMGDSLDPDFETLYSPGACFDGRSPTTVYLGKQVSGHAEIQQWSTADAGATWAKDRDLTTGSSSVADTHNFRPCSPKNYPVGSPYPVLFCAGKYVSYNSYAQVTIAAWPGPPIEAHVKVPSVSSATDTEVYVYYKNSAASNQENVTGVWDSTFIGVYHFAFTPTTGTMRDVTTNGRHATMKSSGVSAVLLPKPLVTTKHLNTMLDFDGSADYLDLGTQHNFAGLSGLIVEALLNHDGGGADTVEFPIFSAWISGDVSTAGVLFRLEPGASYTPEVFVIRQTDTQLGGQSGGAVSAGAIHHIAMRYDSTDLRAYIDGTLDGSPIAGGSAMDATASATATMGLALDDYFNGKIDEVRIHNAARTAGWITASANNLKNVATFLTIGSEEEPSSGSLVPLRQPNYAHLLVR